MASTIEGIRNRLIKDQASLEKDIDGVIKDLELFLAKNLNKILEQASKGKVDPILLLNDLIQNFKDAGLSSQMGNIAELYGRELNRARESAIAEGWVTEAQFDTIIDFGTIESLIRFRVEDIQNRSVQTIGALRPVILENIILGTQPDFTALAETASTALINYTKTELNTALLSFSRMTIAVQSEALGIDEYIYLGPFDKITRKFCQSVLTSKSPPIYTSAEIKALQNDSGLPVSIYGGGYNCRHRWKPVSPELSKRLKNGN